MLSSDVANQVAGTCYSYLYETDAAGTALVGNPIQQLAVGPVQFSGGDGRSLPYTFGGFNAPLIPGKYYLIFVVCQNLANGGTAKFLRSTDANPPYNTLYGYTARQAGFINLNNQNFVSTYPIANTPTALAINVDPLTGACLRRGCRGRTARFFLFCALVCFSNFFGGSSPGALHAL